MCFFLTKTTVRKQRSLTPRRGYRTRDDLTSADNPIRFAMRLCLCFPGRRVLQLNTTPRITRKEPMHLNAKTEKLNTKINNNNNNDNLKNKY